MGFGEKIRAERLKNNMTLDQLSARVNVSKSLLSQIERNISVPTVTKLKRIIDALGMDFSQVFSDDENTVDANDRNGENRQAKRVAVVRKGERKKLVMPWGAWYEMLCPDLKGKIQFVFINYPPGARAEVQYSHDGEECGVILEGIFKGTIGDEQVILEAGDSIYYDSTIPHVWEVVGDKEVKAIWAITPPSF